MNPVDYLPFVLLGALTGLDVVSFPQVMVSRPLVAATLAGALAGDAERGLLLGAVLEMVALGTLPFGASKYPDWGSASVVGGAVYGADIAVGSGALALAVLVALLAAWLSGESMILVRTMNARRARAARTVLDTGRSDVVMSLQLNGLVSDLLRGAIVTAVALALLTPAYTSVAELWTGGMTTERTVLAGLTSALGAATVWVLVRGTSGARALIAAGLVIGMLLVLT